MTGARDVRRTAAISILLLPWAGRGAVAQDAGEPGGAAETPDTTHVLPLTGLTVRVGSPAGEPVAGASVRLSAGEPATEPLEVPEVGRGRYTLSGLAAGTYRLEVRALGYADYASNVELDRRSAEVEVALDIRPVPVAEVVAAVDRAGGGSMPGHATSLVPLDGGPRTLADRLAEEPGVQVRSSVSGGAVGSVRGSRPEGLLVLLDGLPLNDPLTGSADLSRIPVSTLERATLLRGASPRFGSGAIGGVLLLESRTPSGTSYSGGAEVGSFGRLAADGYVSLAGEPGALALGFRLEGIDNDFVYPNRILPGSPPEVRENADERGLHLWLSGSPAALPIFAQIRYDDVDRGAPGRMGTHAFDEARYGDRSLQAALGYGSAGGRLSATVARRDLLYRDPRQSVESRQSLSSFRLAGSAWIQRFSLEISSYVARESMAGDQTAEEPSRWSGGVWVGRAFEAGRLAVQPGLATDVSTDGGAVSPEVAVAAQLGSAWALWGRAGSAYRLPTFADLYAPAARRIRANPDLEPERVVLDAEAGVAWSSESAGDGARGGLDVQASLFFRRTNNPIVWVASAVALWSPRNLDRLTAAGFELRADAPLGARGPRAGGFFTFQRSRLGFGDNRNPMPYQPDLAGEVYVNGVLERVWLRGAVSFLGSRTTTIAGVRRLPAHATVRVDASRGVRLGSVSLEAALAINNLLGTSYELTELFPEPGRSFVFRLELRQ